MSIRPQSMTNQNSAARIGSRMSSQHKPRILLYATKLFSAVMAMASLGNSNCGLRPKHQHLLYRSCILPIATYGIRLWFFKGAKYKGTLKELTQMQRHTAIWILGAFKTSSTGVVETLAGLTPLFFFFFFGSAIYIAGYLNRPLNVQLSKST